MASEMQDTFETPLPKSPPHNGRSSRPKYVLITGCGQASGVGVALAEQFHSRGFHVICTVRPGASREHLANKSGYHILEVDVTNDHSVLELKAAVEKLTDGYLDILCNNAGIVYQVPAVDYDLAMVEHLFATNAIGPIRMITHFHRLLIKAQGTIVNVSSVAAYFPSMYQAAYCGSKAAVEQYSNTLRIEMAPLGVKVITIVAGEIDTGILDRDLGRTISPDSVYAPMSKRYEENINRKDVRMAPAVWAKGVVNHVLRPNPSPRYWKGTFAWVIKMLHRFFPRQIYDFISWRKYHLDELANVPKTKMM